MKRPKPAPQAASKARVSPAAPPRLAATVEATAHAAGFVTGVLIG